RCPNTLLDGNLRCTLKEGHISDCDFEPAVPAKVCTCDVAYEFAPHPCAVHGVKDEKPQRKRFKIPKPAPMSDLVPASDYVIAQRLSKVQEKFHELQEAIKDHPDSMVLKQAVIETLKKRDNILNEHARQQAEYDEWVQDVVSLLECFDNRL